MWRSGGTGRCTRRGWRRRRRTAARHVWSKTVPRLSVGLAGGDRDSAPAVADRTDGRRSRPRGPGKPGTDGGGAGPPDSRAARPSGSRAARPLRPDGGARRGGGERATGGGHNGGAVRGGRCASGRDPHRVHALSRAGPRDRGGHPGRRAGRRAGRAPGGRVRGGLRAPVRAHHAGQGKPGIRPTLGPPNGFDHTDTVLLFSPRTAYSPSSK